MGEQTDTNTTFAFSRGGFQGSEGFSSAAEWFIENIAEELDAPLEFFFDPGTKELSFVPNGTLPSNAVFVATQSKVLFELAGTGPDSLVSNVTIRGLRLRDTAQRCGGCAVTVAMSIAVAVLWLCCDCAHVRARDCNLNVP